MWTYHHETTASVPVGPEQLFDYLDDHTRLASHMGRSSWMMGGGRMEIEVDPDHGRRIGSRIRLSGRVFGIRLSLEEAVTEREPPRHKAWETVGQPTLLVIGSYRMGFDIVPQSQGAELRVFIDYCLPYLVRIRWLTRLLASFYARWCTRQMTADAAAYFASGTGSS